MGESIGNAGHDSALALSPTLAAPALAPTLSPEQAAALQPEVRDHEPLGALTDGGVGTAVIDRVIKGAFERLTSGGLLLVEIGIGQDQTVLKAAKTEEWASTGIERDFQGIPRTLVFKRS